jgi:3'-5' exoribonuclease
MKQRISQLRAGDRVDSYFSVKYKKPAKEYRYGWMFEFRVADASGEATAKYWGGKEEEVAKVHGSFSGGDVVHLIGEVREFGGALEMGISQESGNAIDLLAKDQYELAELVGASPVDAHELLAEVKKLAATVKEPSLARLLRLFFEDATWLKEFSEAPASMLLHENYIGGLLEHSLKVAEICDAVSRMYESLDRDLMVAGALLHDVGKVRELSVGTNIDVSEEGMLRGHVVIGEELVNVRVAKVEGFPPLLKLKLDHILLSHHGKKEWGSPKEPQTPEALVLHMADMLDAQVFQFLRARATADTDDPWIWDKRLGHVYLK